MSVTVKSNMYMQWIRVKNGVPIHNYYYTNGIIETTPHDYDTIASYGSSTILSSCRPVLCILIVISCLIVTYNMRVRPSCNYLLVYCPPGELGSQSLLSADKNSTLLSWRLQSANL